MKNVRILYKKGGGMRFCSHLDITRFAARIIRRAGLPVWYTEGFNPHLYLTFALPLPLGFIGEYEIMDIRIVDDDYDISAIPEILNSFCPADIRFLSATEEKRKPAELKTADFTLCFDDKGKIVDALSTFLASDSITVLKRTKHGGEKLLDVRPHLRVKALEVDENGDTVLKINLPAGGALNINPELILNAFFEQNGSEYFCYTVTRTALLDKNGERY